jgi:hypothetical protein
MEVDQERIERRDREDTAAIIQRATEVIADRDNLPPEYAELWIRNEYLVDPELHEAWDNRHDSEEAARWCQRCVRHAFGRLRQAAKMVPDKEATDNRELVAHSVRSHGNKAPEGKAPDLSKLSDQEARAAIEKEYGYTPGF